ncbi:MAG TPA: hypothetical protein VHP33_21170 [Polyangiaceae bacterium]|nr:hypothetical protein [Polyangiaceae bacterium]
MRFGAQLWATSSFLLLLGCSDAAAERPRDEERWLVQDPLAELPAKLSDVGIYAESDVSNPLAPAVAYEPGFPLWSDGGKKFRSLVLPEGSHVDASDADDYVFPLGTLIFKTFAFKTAQSPDDEVPIETRLLRLKADGWELSAYAWNDAATDAELLDLKRSQSREVLSDEGEVVEHAIPSRLECKQCHESAESEILGINELQLAKSGSLGDVLARLEPPPRTPYRALPEHGPLTQAVLGYLVGNCVHCHNGSNGAASSFDLRPDVALDNVVNRPTESSATADGLRVVPGKPDESILYLGVKGGTELEVKDMPPVGVALRDASAVQLLADWILALGNEEDP